MAKLSAHGIEVCRLVIINDNPRPLWDRDTTTACESHLSYRSDGHILRKEVTVNLHGDGKRHDHGWKLWKRFSDRKITPDRMKAHARRIADRCERHGERTELSI